MNKLPIILLLGLIVMFEFIPSTIVASKIFSLPRVPILLSVLIGLQVAVAILSVTSIIMLWKDYRHSKVFTLIMQYLIVAIPLIYVSILTVGLYRYEYMFSGMFFLLTFTSGIAAFLAFINIIILGIILGKAYGR